MTYPAGPDAARGRRQSMTETYLPRAVAAGARMLAGCRVDRLVLDGGRAVRAEVTRDRRAAGTVDFRHVFVCGGAIQTPALLQRSGLRHRIGRTLAVHPTVKLAARFAEPSTCPTTCRCTRSRSSPPTCPSAARRPIPGSSPWR